MSGIHYDKIKLSGRSNRGLSQNGRFRLVILGQLFFQVLPLKLLGVLTDIDNCQEPQFSKIFHYSLGWCWWSLTLELGVFLFKLVQLDQIRKISQVSPQQTCYRQSEAGDHLLYFVSQTSDTKARSTSSYRHHYPLSTTTTIISYSTCVGSCLVLSNITFFEVSSQIFYIFHICLSV